MRFTSSYNPQSDPAEHANRQVLEDLRTTVVTVVQYDEWDEALPHVTFGLNTHMSTTTKVSPFEFAHGLPARVPLTMGLAERQEFDDDTQTISLIERMENRHKAASDHMTASKVCAWVICWRNGRLPHELWQGTKCGWTLNTPIDIPYKLTARWFGPFEVLSQMELP